MYVQKMNLGCLCKGVRFSPPPPPPFFFFFFEVVFAVVTINFIASRFSLPGNFTDADISEPIFEVELEAGDLLYFPRGYIHQVR